MSNLEADHELGQFREQSDVIDFLRLMINLANDFQPQAKDNLNKSILVNDDSFHKIFKTQKLKIERNLVAQAVSNVLENAVKYADADSRIVIRAIEEKGYIGCGIKSEGIPISDEEASKIFERNFRGDAAKQKVPAGTGIGLYLVYHIMGIHNGKINVIPNNKITEFVLLFPKKDLSD